MPNLQVVNQVKHDFVAYNNLLYYVARPDRCRNRMIGMTNVFFDFSEAPKNLVNKQVQRFREYHSVNSRYAIHIIVCFSPDEVEYLSCNRVLEIGYFLAETEFNKLPYRKEQKIYLAVFAAMLTGNPHAFDRGTVGGRILEQMIHRSLEQRNLLIEGTEIFPAYKRQKSFLAAGILLDDVSNYAMVCNVEAVKKDGTIHMGMDGFQKEKDMLQVPLGVISDWKEVRCLQQKIYIVENPSVFAMLCGKAECSCMCMNGQPRLAGLMLLDLLEKSGTTIYYSGDLDPEGILIAQKLADYYRGKFHFWHMDPEDYNKSRSEEVISDRRMKILDKITDVRLISVVDEIKKYKTAGYQERIFV